MQSEIAALKAAMQLPGVPDDEKKIYVDTIAQIEQAIAAAKTKPPSTEYSRPAVEQPGTRQNTRAEHSGAVTGQGAVIPTTKIRAGIDKPRTQGADLQTGEKYQDRPIIAAVVSAGAKQVIIDWGAGAYDAFTEGEARGRLTTALRDLTESRMARIGRWDDLEQYTTFGRAVAYYRAMILFWNEPPSAKQLAIAPLKGVKSEIFERIKNAAVAAQNQGT